MTGMFDWSEADEIAANVDAAKLHTEADCRAHLREFMGDPNDVGFQIFDNTLEALWARVQRERGWTA